MEYDIFDYKPKLYDTFGRALEDNPMYRFRVGGMPESKQRVIGGGRQTQMTDGWTPDKGIDSDSIDNKVQVDVQADMPENGKKPLVLGGDHQLLFISRLMKQN